MKWFFLSVGILTAVAIAGIVHCIVTERWKRGVMIVLLAGLSMTAMGVMLIVKLFGGQS